MPRCHEVAGDDGDEDQVWGLGDVGTGGTAGPKPGKSAAPTDAASSDLGDLDSVDTPSLAFGQFVVKADTVDGEGGAGATTSGGKRAPGGGDASTTSDSEPERRPDPLERRKLRV